MVKYFIIIICCAISLALGTSSIAGHGATGHTQLSQPEKEFLAGLTTVRLGVWTNVPPYMLLGPGDSFQGIIAESVSLISQRTGIAFKITPYASFAQAWQGALRGEVDALAAVTPSAKHLAAFNMSKPYLIVPIALMTREGFPQVLGFRDLMGKKVVVGKDHVAEQWIRRDYPAVQVVPLESYYQGLSTVAEGKADAMAGPLGAMLYVAKQGQISNLKLATSTEYQYHLCFAVRKDWPLLPGILDRGIDAIGPKEQADIYNRWVVLRMDKTVDWVLVSGISLAVLLCAGLVVGFIHRKNRLLQEEITQRKKVAKELKDARQHLKDIIDFLPDPTWAIDIHGRVILWNKAVERISGRLAQDILGKGSFEHALPFYGERRPCLIDLVLNRDDYWETQYLELYETDGELAFSESFHPGLGEGGTYLAGSAARLYDSEGNLVGAIETTRDITAMKKGQAEREKLIQELQEALAKVRTLSGLLPICSNCKKIRDDQGYWNEVEEYLQDHSQAAFSHSICPECMTKLYPEVAAKLAKKEQGD